MNFNVFLVTIILLTVTHVSAKNFIQTNSEIQYGIVNYENLYRLILLNEIRFPEVVFAQAILESSNFKSDLFTLEKNLFGMKQPVYRKTTSKGKSRSGYASYYNWINSVQDYQIWQTNNMSEKIKTQDEYFRFLHKNYAEDKNYVKKLKTIVTQNKEFFSKFNA